MSADIKKVLVKDDRLNCTDQIAYAVMKGGQSMNPASFQAVSQGNSSHVYNINVPSETTIIDRRVLWKSTVILSITGTAPAGQFLVNYGLTDALSAFPLHQLVNVMSAVVNNNSVSLNVRDVLPALLRFQDRKEVQRYNGYTPVQFDVYQKYSDGVGAINNPLGAWSNTGDNDVVNRGSWVLDGLGINADATGVIPVSTGAQQTVYAKFTVSEPLIISPFIMSHPQSNNQGFYGIQNMTFTFSMGDATRVWRHASTFAKTVSVVSFTNSQLLFNFLTPHPSDLLPSRNVCGYSEFPRYITSFGSSLNSGATFSYKSSTISLNQIPDKLIMFVRKTMSSQINSDSDSFLALHGDNPLSINFNNVSGILSSASQQDLYRYSVENGYNGSWYEWSGFANLNNTLTGAGKKTPTTGCMLVLEFGKDIPLQEDFYAPSSLGQFSLQVNLNCVNQSADAIATQELVIITMNSGCFVCERGASSTFTGLLTKSDVLECSSQMPYYGSDVKRLVGGGWFDTLKSVIGRILPVLAPLGKQFLEKQGALGQTASKVISALGYGQSGGMKGKLQDRMM